MNKNHSFIGIVLTSYLVGCGGGGGGGGGRAPPAAAPAVTLSFSTTNGVVPYGQPISLNWISSASTCTAQDDWSGDKSAGGSTQFTVDRSVVLTLKCASGTSKASASIRIEAIGTGSPTTSTLAYSATGLATLNYVVLPIDGVAQVYDPVGRLIYADSQTLNKIDQVIVPKPSGLSSIGGPFRLVRPGNSNTLALVTNYGYVVTLSGSMFAK